ncbi:MAG: hypothetical protein MNSN_10100 [Minisyncoccus archaeiphilus]|uniref:hypothetical protein n=1 Tax=Minisyncoccus archaeiphilus TaxID=3238481 RepID=UPI0009C60A86|nr:MAG: hypothetical protein BWY21_01033 [Parcubacteria group bacterium ADurb.Bin216]GMX59991.1 MAG: hypothetical protein MNSN_10100 [Candidatus Parcubacteria bacterium]
MPTHVWSIICQNSSIDSNTNLISLFSCLEDITIGFNPLLVDEKIIIPIEFNVISFWTIDHDEKLDNLIVRIRIVDSKGVELLHREDSISIKKEWIKFRNVVHFSGLPISTKSFGRYYIEVSHKKPKDNSFTEIARLPLDIKVGDGLLEGKV